MVAYAEGMIDGSVPVNKYRVKAAERFLRDLENPEYEIRESPVIFCTMLIENTFRHIKGPLRGELYILEPWQRFIVFNLVGFYHKGTNKRRFQEAFIFIPRKNSKTFFASALAWALAMLEKDQFAVLYIVATKLDRAREAFDNIAKNLTMMGEIKNFRVLDNNSEHSITRTFETGELKIQALAADTDRADGLNGNIFILDELHAYKSANDYAVYKQAMKAYENKLLIGITTAGTNMNSFCHERLEYCKKVLDRMVNDEPYFIFVCEADDPKDYTNACQHQIANPNYGVTIKPDEIMAEAMQAQNDPGSRSLFLNKSLNIYTNAMEAYFDFEEFRASDMKYDWTPEELAKLGLTWYGGADLSKMHDLTAACLYTNYKGVDIVISHAFFPITEAQRKATEDNIPLFGWQDDGQLTMCNSPTVQYEDVVRWFTGMKKMGFKIKRTGVDRRFAREFKLAMKKAGLKTSDMKQYTWVKAEGFRRIERMAKEGNLYYLHSQAYEYCVKNVRAIEDSEDTIKYQKLQPTQRIDLFDASVFACNEYLYDQDRSGRMKSWLEKEK